MVTPESESEKRTEKVSFAWVSNATISEITGLINYRQPVCFYKTTNQGIACGKWMSELWHETSFHETIDYYHLRADLGNCLKLKTVTSGVKGNHVHLSKFVSGVLKAPSQSSVTL